MILAIFISLGVALFLTLIFTPLVRRLAYKIGVLDYPSDRKTHKVPIPRMGGVALFTAILFGGGITSVAFPNLYILGIPSEKLGFVMLAGALVFTLGLWDDIKQLPPLYKLIVQIVAACIAIYGDVIIAKITVPFGAGELHLGFWGVPVTIIWYLLVINGFNLIDGLDGLASGVCLFASLLLLISAYSSERFIVSIFLAAMVGANLGFLRYNFYPASIFMGDSGSYFLGFMLATLAILGSIKGQTTVAILVPIISLGFPLFDSILSAIRRFLFGRSFLLPDKDHIHHKILKLGIDHRKAVLILYIATICLGLSALWVMHVHDASIALVFFTNWCRYLCRY